jgi:hypothetical protein
MASNPRLSITFTKRHFEFLEKEAARLGIPLSEIVRQIVDRRVEQKEASALVPRLGWLAPEPESPRESRTSPSLDQIRNGCARRAIELSQPAKDGEHQGTVHRRRVGPCVAKRKERSLKPGRKPKLTEPQRREAIERRDEGLETLAEIGRSYNVSAATISRLTA